MTSLTIWDKKSAKLSSEIKDLFINIVKKQESSSQLFSEERKKAKYLEQIFEQDISEILSSEQNRDYLNETEKIILHWSSNIARKLAQFADNLQFSLRFIFWCRLILLQRLGTLKCNHAHDELFDILKNQEDQQVERLKQANKYLEDLRKEDKNLFLAYEKLMIIKNNKDGLFLLQQIGSKQQVLRRFAIYSKTIKRLAKIRSWSNDKEKITALISQPMTRDPSGKKQPLRLG